MSVNENPDRKKKLMSSDDIFKGNKVYFSLFDKFLHLLLILRYCSTEALFKFYGNLYIGLAYRHSGNLQGAETIVTVESRDFTLEASLLKIN